MSQKQVLAPDMIATEINIVPLRWLIPGNKSQEFCYLITLFTTEKLVTVSVLPIKHLPQQQVLIVPLLIITPETSSTVLLHTAIKALYKLVTAPRQSLSMQIYANEHPSSFHRQYLSRTQQLTAYVTLYLKPRIEIIR